MARPPALTIDYAGKSGAGAGNFLAVLAAFGDEKGTDCTGWTLSMAVAGVLRARPSV